jgi:hypothetical protein
MGYTNAEISKKEKKWERLSLVSLGDIAVIRCYHLPFTPGKPFSVFLLFFISLDG